VTTHAAHPWTAHAGSDATPIACRYCGTVHEAPVAPRRGFQLACATCGSELERPAGLDVALALSSATLLLLIPANLLPFLATSVAGVSRQSVLASAGTILWREGWAWLGLVVLLFVVVLPPIRFALLTAVLACLRTSSRPRWLGPAFRFANLLQTWAMADVFLLALWVAHSRLAATISVSLGSGAVCFVLAGLGTLLTRAALDKGAVWKAIGSPPAMPPAERGDIACPSCDLVLDAGLEGHRCPRCSARVRARQVEPIGRAAALTLAGLILYAPANIYPIATLPIGFTPTAYTVIEGVRDLIQAGLLGLAFLVFCASFLIPMLKLAGISWLIASVLRRSASRLVVKTRLYKVVDEIGRWSMVDPFVIGCSVPVMQYNELITARGEAGATAFAAVVILTIVAAQCFDPRLLWDAARRTDTGGTGSLDPGSLARRAT